ncbi:hypothetical protein ABIE52_001361 [Rhodococcus sp. OAS809]
MARQCHARWNAHPPHGFRFDDDARVRLRLHRSGRLSHPDRQLCSRVGVRYRQRVGPRRVRARVASARCLLGRGRSLVHRRGVRCHRDLVPFPSRGPPDRVRGRVRPVRAGPEPGDVDRRCRRDRDPTRTSRDHVDEGQTLDRLDRAVLHPTSVDRSNSVESPGCAVGALALPRQAGEDEPGSGP